MDDRRLEQAKNHPAVRFVSRPDHTGELSWPLVERRQERTRPPTGIERRSAESLANGSPGLRKLKAWFSGFGRESMDERSRDARQLASANQLLVSLQKIAINLPSSFDLDTVLDEAETQVRNLLDADIVTIFVSDRANSTLTPVRGRGSLDQQPVSVGSLPVLAREALGLHRSTGSSPTDSYSGFASEAVQGACCALRSRGSVVGVIVAEWRRARNIDKETQVLTGLSDALAMAIDNAYLFKDLRRRGADQERRRIARDLHDRTGSTLALLGFEIDRLVRNEVDASKTAELAILRSHVDSVLGEVREMLFDIRSGPDGTVSLEASLREFVRRIETRTPGNFVLQLDEIPKFEVVLSNEIWEIVKEAITNSERHSEASLVRIVAADRGDYFEIAIADNGIGFDPAKSRSDSYGLTGMRERADSIDCGLAIDSSFGLSDSGTTITLRIPRSHYPAPAGEPS